MKIILRLRYWMACFDYITRDVYDLHQSEARLMRLKKELEK